jgi:hypothetical protein
MVSLGFRTQNELAAHLDLQVWTLSKVLRGRRKNADVMRKLVRFAYGKKTEGRATRAA